MTVWPRFFFGNSASFTPPAVVKVVRFMMLAWLGSKSSALEAGRLRPEILQQAWHAGRRRDHGALRMVVRDEYARDAVIALEITVRRRCDLVRRDLVDAVAADEEQAPVAQRDDFRQGHADLLRIVQAALESRSESCASRAPFLLASAGSGEVLDGLGQRGAHRFDGSSFFTTAPKYCRPGA